MAKIQIKRSATSAAPTSLDSGELAYSFQSQKLFIGNPDQSVAAIGGDGVFVTPSEVESAIEGKANSDHTHLLIDVQGIAEALAQKANSDHSHNFAVNWDSPGAIGSVTPNTATFTQLTVQSGTLIAIQTFADGGVRFRTKVGFFDRPPQGKPSITGSRGGNLALQDLLSSLHSMGLITNNTTA